VAGAESPLRSVAVRWVSGAAALGGRNEAGHGLVEFGHLQRYEVTRTRRGFVTHKDRPLATPKQVAAKPFIRPAMDKFAQAQEAARVRFLADLAERGVL